VYIDVFVVAVVLFYIVIMVSTFPVHVEFCEFHLQPVSFSWYKGFVVVIAASGTAVCQSVTSINNKI
jgi:hypothetical protein